MFRRIGEQRVCNDFNDLTALRGRLDGLQGPTYIESLPIEPYSPARLGCPQGAIRRQVAAVTALAAFPGVALSLIGPVFFRDVQTIPRRGQFYASRTIYVLALFGLTLTAWLVLSGTQEIRTLGDLARFSGAVFQILLPLQLVLVILFSALLAAAAVAQEKDRQTLVLLLLTRMSNVELVMGKFLASLMNILVLIAAGLPLFMLLAMLGGITYEQIVRAMAVTLSSALAAGSLGSTLALWREKTFQALALTFLLVVLWFGASEWIASGGWGEEIAGVPAHVAAIAVGPWQAIASATRPAIDDRFQVPIVGSPSNLFVLLAVSMAALLNMVAILRVRVWNAGRQAPILERTTSEAGDSTDVHSAGGRARRMWNNPILWREMRTWAYGRKIIVIRGFFLVMFLLVGAVLWNMTSDPARLAGMGVRIPPEAKPFVPFMVLGLILVNALAVVSLTNERDGRALELLLVTDLTPKEMIYGKLGGVLYNAKEFVLLPMLLCGLLWQVGRLGTLDLIYLVLGLALMNGFAAMLGIHAGMSYSNSRSAIATSIGTLLFLFIGVATCMRMMLAFRGSFYYQLQCFSAFMAGGGLGLFFALGARNPSPAIGLASFLAPFATFYVIVSFLLGKHDEMFWVTMATYGFAIVAMLTPAIAEFDVATGRTTAQET